MRLSEIASASRLSKSTVHRILSAGPARRFSYFLPHSKGRGRLLADRRITRQEFDALPEEIRNSFQHTRHMTEAEWLSSGGKTPLQSLPEGSSPLSAAG